MNLILFDGECAVCNNDPYSPYIVGTFIILSDAYLVIQSAGRTGSALFTRAANFLSGNTLPSLAKVLNSSLCNFLRAVSIISLGLAWVLPIQAAKDLFPATGPTLLALQVGLFSAYMLGVIYAQTRIIRDIVLAAKPKDEYRQALVNTVKLYDDVVELLSNASLTHLETYLLCACEQRARRACRQ